MSAQSSTTKKSSSLLANLKSSYSSGNALSFGQAAPTAVAAPTAPISTVIDAPVTEQVATEQVATVQANDLALKLDTADAIIENIIARRLEDPIPASTPTPTPTPAPAEIPAPMPTQVSAPWPVVTEPQLAPQTNSEPQPQAQVPQAAQLSPQLAEQPQAPVTTPQAFPMAVDQLYQEQQVQLAAQQQAYAQLGFASKKESQTSISPDATIADSGSGIQYVEQEKSPEMPVEVEGFLQHVDDNATQAPQEIIMAQLAEPVALPTVIPKQAVVVLPITPDVEQTAKGKGTKYSVKWLVEWSHKMMKLFEGSVVYRPTDNEEKK